MLKKYKTCNSTVRFSKYEFNNKLLSDVTSLKFTVDRLGFALYTTSHSKRPINYRFRLIPLLGLGLLR